VFDWVETPRNLIAEVCVSGRLAQPPARGPHTIRNRLILLRTSDSIHRRIHDAIYSDEAEGCFNAGYSDHDSEGCLISQLFHLAVVSDLLLSQNIFPPVSGCRQKQRIGQIDSD